MLSLSLSLSKIKKKNNKTKFKKIPFFIGDIKQNFFFFHEAEFYL